MKPIEYKLRDNHNFIQNEKEVVDFEQYDDGEMIPFNPEWLEEIMKDYPAATHNNLKLVEYNNNKDTYTYIATWKQIEHKVEYYVEYYYINKNTIIAYYSQRYAKNPRELRCVFIWHRKNQVQ